MKDLLKVRFELFVAPLFITLFIISITKIGFFTLSDIIFNIFVLLSIPASYFGIKLSRKLIYEVWYEN